MDAVDSEGVTWDRSTVPPCSMLYSRQCSPLTHVNGRGYEEVRATMVARTAKIGHNMAARDRHLRVQFREGRIAIYVTSGVSKPP